MASVPASVPRRERFGHRKEGTGRTASVRHFDIRGPRTGWQPPTDVPRDEHGFEDLGAFFGKGDGVSSAAARIDFGAAAPSGGGGGGTPGGAALIAMEGGLADLAHYDDDSGGGGSSAAPSPAPAPAPAVSTGLAGVRAHAAAGGAAAKRSRVVVGDDDEEEEAAPPAARKARAKGGAGGRLPRARGDGDDDGAAPADASASDEDAGFRRRPKGATAGGKGKKPAKAAASKRPVARRYTDDEAHDDGSGNESGGSRDDRRGARAGAGAAARSRRDDRRSESEGSSDEGEKRGRSGNAYQTPHARRHARPSLGVGMRPGGDSAGLDMMEGGRGMRRKWQTMDHWRSERLKYRVDAGAVEAVRDGAATPAVNPPKRKRSSRSESTDRRAKPNPSRKGDGGSRKDSRRDDDDDSGGERRGGKLRRRDGDRDVASRADEKRAIAAAVEKAVTSRDREISELEERLAVALRGTAAQKKLPPSKLPPGFTEAASTMIVVREMDGHPDVQLAAVRPAEDLDFEALASVPVRPPQLPNVALAAATFDTNTFISGSIRMPPRSMKDEESTHTCSQVFAVARAQPRALQLSIDGRNFLLGPGTHFLVPPSTNYLLINHSADTEAEVFFVVMKPTVVADGGGDGEGGDGGGGY